MVIVRVSVTTCFACSNGSFANLGMTLDLHTSGADESWKSEANILFHVATIKCERTLGGYNLYVKLCDKYLESKLFMGWTYW